MSKCYDIPRVIIIVRGGVAEVLEKPRDVDVEIRDYDWDGSKETCKDKNGDPYVKGVY